MQFKVNQFRGKLTPQQIADGINAAIANARRLADDAKLLLEASRYPTALSIAALSIEEAGKIGILLGLAVSDNQEDITKKWKEYKSHTSKNAIWGLFSAVAKGARKLDDFRDMFDPKAEHPFQLDHMKQFGFYTDCVESGTWVHPNKMIDEELAKIIVDIADILAREPVVTPREIELWIKYLKPAWGKNKELMEHGLLQWEMAMREEGLTTDKDMEKFIKEGFGDE